MKIWSRPIAQNMNEKFEKFCPEHLGQNFSNIFVHILGNSTISYFHFEIYWPLSTPTSCLTQISPTQGFKTVPTTYVIALHIKRKLRNPLSAKYLLHNLDIKP